MSKMIAIIVTAIVVLGTSFAQAKAKTCLISKSGEATIKSLTTGKTEKARTVAATLEDATTENGELVPERLAIKAKSKTMRYSTIAIRFDDMEPGTYVVECDGGTAKLTHSANGYTLNSESLYGAIKGNTGCGGEEPDSEGIIVLKNLILEEKACAK
ncbi:hypothetical protein ACLVWU_05140 [Bdellovibrio sp. HCB290]|uniref:hypothetical protein n=1 Tax=Bdellovibrio sp. HCB290 TaxID=3394356 RepID=UPI0039B392C4